MTIKKIETTQGIKLIATGKPSGIASHAVDTDKPGFVDWLSFKIQSKLFLFHRLDKDTSGLMLIGQDSESAAKLTELWNERAVEKIYWVLVGANAKLEDEFEVHSFIDKKDGHYISQHHIPSNAETHFRVLKRFKSATLLQAKLFTGKTHQIRLHLQDKGMPVLGDTLYGGAKFPRLALHSYKISIPQLGIEESCEPPKYFTDFDQFENQPELIELETALHNRSLQTTEGLNTQRLLHQESRNLSLDLFDKTLWLYDYNEIPLTEDKVGKLLSHAQSQFPQIKGLMQRHMLNRGRDSSQENQSLKVFGETQNRFFAFENAMAVEIRTDSGLSPGLFLDQRHNRAFCKDIAKDRSVLNLFAFTGGFSVAAALGGAQAVTTVDVSSTYIQWTKRNFELNQLDTKNYEFWTTDSLLFLKGAHKKARSFDLIICDPPSLGRSKEGTFKLEKDWKTLLQMCSDVLSKDGVLLFSHNLEKWPLTEWKKMLFTEAQKYRLREFQNILPDLDYEMDINQSVLKSVWLIKK